MSEASGGGARVDASMSLSVLIVDVDPSGRVDVAAKPSTRSRMAQRAFAKWAVRALHSTFYAPGRIQFAKYRAATREIVGLRATDKEVDLVLLNASGILGSDTKQAAAALALRECHSRLPHAPLLAVVWPPAKPRQGWGVAAGALLAEGATDYLFAHWESLAAHRLTLMLAAWCNAMGTVDEDRCVRIARNLMAKREPDARG